MIQSHFLPYFNLHSYTELFKAVKGPDPPKSMSNWAGLDMHPALGRWILIYVYGPNSITGDCKPMGSWAQIDFIGIAFLEVSMVDMNLWL